ncbi:MAG: aminotransferase class V-fold PLP-dependent enzyme [Ardenticatenaceae bacterium]|nr:aminotransferase class V-fold PLP-dependent enzyme [Ardenticatenaceae bacterium]MCB9443753.1 aminotransferase class V-fold PLP-dependent enzyme [Ardenticatenaceae bacterium]
MNNLRALFSLDPDVVFLNHGSFGATPLPVLEVYQQWQQRLERQPVRFLATELPDLLAEARTTLADYVGAAASDVAFIPNATFGVNLIARSLPLGPGDEVLTTDHEYGACDNVWTFLSQKQGFSYKKQPVPLPIQSPDEVVDQFWQGVTDRTRVIFISHISSATAVTFPIAQICARARQAGILTIVDGAHTVGQIPLDMAAIDADFYLSNAHKWLCSPKGSAFMYARHELHHLLEPLVVSWGWGENKQFSYGSNLLDYLQWMGTGDPSAYLAVPAAIAFQQEHHWPDIRRQCHELLRQAVTRIGDLTGLESPCPDDSYYHQMAVAPLPAIPDLVAFKARFYDTYRVEVPFTEWNGRQFVRISVQGYNSSSDIDALVDALNEQFFAP